MSVRMKWKGRILVRVAPSSGVQMIDNLHFSEHSMYPVRLNCGQIAFEVFFLFSMVTY